MDDRLEEEETDARGEGEKRKGKKLEEEEG